MGKSGAPAVSTDKEKGCPFCNVNEDRILMENEKAMAIRDNFPVNPGHTLVVSKRHTGDWFDVSREERDAIMDLVGQVKMKLDREIQPAGYNIGTNVGEAAGQTVMHIHVHVIPRMKGDVDDPRGGVRLVIPERGNYKRPKYIPKARQG